MDEPGSFGAWLKARRRALRLTQDELAQRLNVALGTVRKWETEERRPSVELATQLAHLLQLPDETHARFVRVARAQLTVDDLPTAIPKEVQPPSQRRLGPVDLPAPPTSLIGRAGEVAAVDTLLRSEGVRLLTLVGPPGVGKTRLSIQVAMEIADQFPEGVYWVPLAALTKPDLVIPAVAASVGVVEAVEQSLVDGLTRALRSRQVLLVLDNCEHVIEAMPVIGQLLQAAPRLKVLATSRMPLHLYGEHEYTVPPLPVPPTSAPLAVEQLIGYEAMRLFCARAQAVRNDFYLTHTNASAVAHICERLDGLPLALELAAARIKLWEPQALLQLLTDRFDVLVGGPRDLHPRHQTLQAAISWSYNLLTPDEQTLFRRLGVFQGSWTLAAVAEVQGGQVTEAIRTSHAAIRDGLLALREHNLIRLHTASGDEERWTTLPTLHEYGRLALLASDEAEAVQQRHAHYFLRLAEAAEPALRGPDEEQWLQRLAAEHDNLRAALRWLLERNEITAGMHMVGALLGFWEVRCYYAEGRTWAEAFLAKDEARLQPTGDDAYVQGRAETLYAAGRFAERQGDRDTMRVHMQASVPLFKSTGDLRRYYYARVFTEGDNSTPMDHRRALYEEGLAFARQTGHKGDISEWLSDLAWLALWEKKYDEDAALAAEALALAIEWGNKSGIALCSLHLSYLAKEQGQYDAMTMWLRKALRVFCEIGDRRRVGRCLADLGVGAQRQRLYVRSARLIGAGEVNWDATGAGRSRDYWPYDEVLAIIRHDVGDSVCMTAWNEGRAMTLDEAVAYALADNGVGR